MVYLGSKSKIAKDIVPLLQNIIDKNNIKTYIEPFVGGANIIDKIECENKIGYDKNKYIIALHQKLQENPFCLPEQQYSREQWDIAKAIYRNESNLTMEDWEVGAIMQLCSFNTRGFPGGYITNSTKDYHNRRQRCIEQASLINYQNISFLAISYEDIPDYENCLFYCDPPYQGTKKYGYSYENQFDYEHYWDWIRKISKNNIVICSEQSFPDDFNIIWEQQVRRTVSARNDFKAIEKLGTINII